MRPASRALAVVGGSVTALLGLWGLTVALLGLSVSLQRPDPAVPDGDPCCGHPDTWSEVAIGMVNATAVAIVAVGLVVLGTLLLGRGASGRRRGWLAGRPRPRRVLLTAWWAALVVVVLTWFVLPGLA